MQSSEEKASMKNNNKNKIFTIGLCFVAVTSFCVYITYVQHGSLISKPYRLDPYIKPASDSHESLILDQVRRKLYENQHYNVQKNSESAQRSTDKKVPATTVFKMPQIDLNDKARRPWPDDPTCKKYNISFGEGLTRAFLVSYPRSGNSWTRYLIEGASGIFTGSKYRSTLLAKMGFLGEKLSFKTRRTIIIKIHNHSRRQVPDYSPVVLLIRNPAKALVSYWSYNKRRRGMKRIYFNASGESYKTEGFDRFVSNGLIKWKKIAMDRLTNSQKLLVVFYEDLLADAISQVNRILYFLQVPVNKGRLECLSQHLNGPALGLQRQVDPFTADHRMKMAEYVTEINRMLQKRGMSPLPNYPEMRQ